MYYYLKLLKLGKTPTGAAILSLLLQGKSRSEIADFLCMSYKQVCRIISGLYSDGTIDSDGSIANLPEEFTFPFVYLNRQFISELGLGAAIYFNYQRTWNNGEVGTDNQANKVLGIGVRSITNYKKQLNRKGAIKGGKVDMQYFENVFTNKIVSSVKQNHSDNAREKIRSKLKRTDVVWIFKALCAEYGYTRVPPPLKSDVAKVMQIQDALEADKSDVTVGDLIDRMIRKWPTLWGNKPKVPTLGHLSIYYKDLWDEPQSVTVKIGEKVDIPQGETTITVLPSTEDDDIDDYNSRMIDEEVIG